MTGKEHRDKRIYEYCKETGNALSEMEKRLKFLSNSEYFIGLAKERLMHNVCDSKRYVALCGHQVPETIIRAAGAIPFYIPSGSHALNAFADELLPRDADGFARSVYGYIKNSAFPLNKDMLIIVPLVNDNMKKLYMLLKSEGFSVHGIVFPPVKDEAGYAAWDRQIELLAEAVFKVTGNRITQKKLAEQARIVEKAKKAALSFYKAALHSEMAIDDVGREFLLETYYYADDLEEWTREISLVTEQLKKSPPTEKEGGGVLLAGSPVIFPNMKIPKLIEKSGMRLLGVIDYPKQMLFMSEKVCGGLREIGRGYLKNDSSAAYVENDEFFRGVVKAAESLNVRGIIMHIIKGWIEYDFEAERIEEYFSGKNIPLFRIETDFNTQDVEQLSIRLDAFSEMLKVRGKSKGGADK